MPATIKKADPVKMSDINWTKSNCYKIWGAILFNKEAALLISADCGVSFATISRICDTELFSKRIAGLLSVKPIHYHVWERLWNAYLPIIEASDAAMKATRDIITAGSAKQKKRTYTKGRKFQNQ